MRLSTTPNSQMSLFRSTKGRQSTIDNTPHHLSLSESRISNSRGKRMMINRT